MTTIADMKRLAEGATDKAIQRYTMSKIRLENIRLSNTFGLTFEQRVAQDKEMLEATIEHDQALAAFEKMRGGVLAASLQGVKK